MVIVTSQIARTKNPKSILMKKIKLTLLFIILFFCVNIFAQINIIPKPNNIKINDGICSLKKGVNFKIIRGDEPTRNIQKQVNDFLSRRNIPIITSANTTVLSINLLQNKAGDTIINDAYTLSITNNNIAIVSRTNAGLFYGLQSLYQLIESDTTNVVPCVEIKDEPAYAYRGFELDVCQHFFGVDVIKKYIDAISKLKMNQFILKLADEKAWRLEIKNNSKLLATDTENDSENQYQFYKQDDIKQIIQFAKERFVNIIPEINFGQIITSEDTTFQYKKNIIDEIFTLFPSKYLNVDESIFITQEVEDYLKASGKIIISKDDILFKNSIMLSFKNTKNGSTAASSGNDVIMAPHNLCSLDNYQDWDDSKLSKSMLFLPLDKIYKFDPIAKIKDSKTKAHIIGAQANVNTKFMTNEGKLIRQVYPRIFALAECFWTNNKNKKHYKDFSIRLEKIGYPGQITDKINLVKFK